jgi:hypothetical protein
MLCGISVLEEMIYTMKNMLFRESMNELVIFNIDQKIIIEDYSPILGFNESM